MIKQCTFLNEGFLFEVRVVGTAASAEPERSRSSQNSSRAQVNFHGLVSGLQSSNGTLLNVLCVTAGLLLF